MKFRFPTAALLLLVTAVAFHAAPAAAVTDSVHVALTPATSIVAPNTNFTIDITVTRSGKAFNAYDAVIEWDPAAVSFVSSQEGTYMTGACGNTFIYTVQHADSLLVSHSLLCNQVALTGPGQLYRITFHTANTNQTTHIRF